MVSADQYTRSVSDDASAGKHQFSVGEPFRSHNKFISHHAPRSLNACKTLPHVDTGQPIKITWAAKAVYALVDYHAGKESHCFASQEAMARELGVSVDTIGRAQKVLVSVGLIRRRRQRNRAAICELLWHPVLEGSLRYPDTQDSAKTRIRTPQKRDQDSAKMRSPYKEEEIQEEIQVRESSSSSGSPQRSQVAKEEEEDSLPLQNFLREWRRALQPHRDFQLPPQMVIRAIRRVSPGWTDAQRMEGYRQNALRRTPNPQAPPNGYGYFEIVMKNFYDECQGEPPELPTPKEQPEAPAENSAYRGAPPKPVGCAYCKSSGRLAEGLGYCNRCEKGPELKQREEEEKAIRRAYEAENAERSKQNEEWIAIRKHQPPDVQWRMDFGDLCESFLAATVEKRDEILRQMRDGEHPSGILRLPMSVESNSYLRTARKTVTVA